MFDVAVTSPPYNIGKKDAGPFEVSMSDSAYLDWLMARLERVMECLKPQGSLFLNISGKPSKPHLPYRVVCRMLDAGYVLQNTIQWVKSMSLGVDGRIRSFGHFKPINSKRFVNDLVEPIFHFTKHGDVELNRLSVGVPYEDASNVSRWAGASSNIRCRGNVWFIPYRTRQRKDEHPTAFPVELPRMCIRLHGVERPWVTDPFMGSGTTAVAAALEGAVKFVGYDTSAAAVQIARHRLSIPNFSITIAGGRSKVAPSPSPESL
jgi:site-specific DNA-methyltransferase (adenine-specific)